MFRKLTTAAAGGAVAFSVLIGTSPHAGAIVGGEITDIESVPWQVMVTTDDGDRLCGGTIIHPEWVITAAHCVVGKRVEQLRVHSGLSSWSELGADTLSRVAQSHVHPGWDSSTYRNDAALLKLREALVFNSARQPASLPYGLDPNLWPQAGVSGIVSGWGSTSFTDDSSTELRAVNVKNLVDPLSPACGLYSQYYGDVQLCAGEMAGGVDACLGDSGGPFVVQMSGVPVLAGVSSGGYECARAGYPGLYTRVTTYVPWVGSFVTTNRLDAPQRVVVQPSTGGSLAVSWQAPIVSDGSGLVGYSVQATPGEARCETDGSTNQCVIEGLDPGQAHSISVSALTGSQQVISALPVSTKTVHGTARSGKQVSVKKLAAMIDKSVGKTDKVRISINQDSRKLCKITGSKKKPRGIKGTAPRVCTVRMKVTPSSGKSSNEVVIVAFT